MAVNETTTVFQSGLDLQIDGYDKALKWALRSMPVYDQFSNTFPVDPTNTSRKYHLPKYNYLAASTTPLDELDDPTSQDIPDVTDVTVELAEYGGLVQGSERLLHGGATYVDLNPSIARQVATQAVDTIDTLARTNILTGTNRMTSNAGDMDSTAVNVNTLTAADIFSARLVRRAVAALKVRNVVPLRGENYVAIIHPDTKVNLQEETGAAAWQLPHGNVDTSGFYTGEIGTFAGAVFIESNRAFSDDDGSGSATVHRTVFLGSEAVAKAVRLEPFVGQSDWLDALKRKRGIFWRCDLGYAVYRNEAIQRVEHGVTL